MTTVSRLGIQSLVDSEDYLVCRLCLTLVPTDEMIRHLRTYHIIQTDVESGVSG